MTMIRGVLTIVHSQAKYARHAVNLARSIRLRDPDLSLAVATNLGVAHHVAVDHDASVGHQEGSHFHRETAASGCWKNFLGN